MGFYKTPVLEQFPWQLAVIDKDLSAPPSANKGDRYIVKATGSGAWSGYDNKIAYYDGSSWHFITPAEGFIAWVNDEDSYYYWNGSAWLKSYATQAIDEFFMEVMG
jgi:hypothetical protein